MRKIVVGILLVYLLALGSIGFGSYLNTKVMSENHGKMPVRHVSSLSEKDMDKRHEFITDDSVDVYLADIIPVPGALLSIGDVFIYAGWAFWFVAKPVAACLIILRCYYFVVDNWIKLE